METGHSDRQFPFKKNRIGFLSAILLSGILWIASGSAETVDEAVSDILPSPSVEGPAPEEAVQDDPFEKAVEEIEPGEDDEAQARRALYRAIGEKVEANAYREVIGLIDRYFQEYPVTEANFILLAMKAEILLELNELDQAIRVYEKALLPVLKLEEAAQRKFAPWIMQLGGLYQRSGDSGKAISLIEKGLALEPEKTVRVATGSFLLIKRIPIQIVLGEAYIEAGKNARAVALYQKLLEAPELTEEEGVVIRIKLKRLGRAVVEPPSPFQELVQAPFYKRFTIRLLPINGAGLAIRLKDICFLLESKFRVRCEVLKPTDFKEKTILTPGTNLYDSGRIVELLGKLYPNPKGKQALLIAVTGKEIFGQKKERSFSWQNPDKGIALFSSKEFSPIDPTYEPEVIPTRRAAIQMISVVSDLLGFTRTTEAHCPTSFDGPPEFLMKSTALCEPTLLQRDTFLNGLGIKPGRFDPDQLREIEQIYEKYLFK